MLFRFFSTFDLWRGQPCGYPCFLLAFPGNSRRPEDGEYRS